MSDKTIQVFPKDNEAKNHTNVQKSYFEEGFFVIEFCGSTVRYAISEIFKIYEFESKGEKVSDE